MHPSHHHLHATTSGLQCIVPGYYCRAAYPASTAAIACIVAGWRRRSLPRTKMERKMYAGDILNISNFVTFFAYPGCGAAALADQVAAPILQPICSIVPDAPRRALKLPSLASWCRCVKRWTGSETACATPPPTTTPQPRLICG